MSFKRGVFMLFAAAVALLLAGCATDDYSVLTGAWMGAVDQGTFLTGNNGNFVDVTITIKSDKTWSWSTNNASDTSLDSTGSGTYTLDSSAKTAQFTIATCSSSEVVLGTVVLANYEVASSGNTVTFDFQGTTGATGGSIALAKQ